MANGTPNRPAPAPGNPLPEMLTVNQVAALLSVSHRTVWRMLKRGELPPPIRWNRKLVRWNKPGLLQFLEQLKEGSTGY